MIAGLTTLFSSLNYAETATMLWLIWIAIMLVTPILAGLNVWWETRSSAEALASDISSEQIQA